MLRRVLVPFVFLASLASAADLSRRATDASGVNIHFTDARPGELEMLKAAGFKNVRMDLTWGSTEKEKGVYDFSAYERLIAALGKHGLRPYFILNYSNTLYEKERSVTTPEGRAAYAKWATAAVSHFKGRNVIWEIWNEPNIEGFWKPKPDVAAYAAMALEAVRAIHAAAPGEMIVGPGTSGVDLDFLEACFRAGLLEHWSAVSVHPYRQDGPESVDQNYHSLRRLIAKYAPPGKTVSILAGEWGYSSAWQNHDADRQGTMLARQWLVNAAEGIPVSIWYDWHDDGSDPKEAEHNFGTVTFPYHAGRDPIYDPKPAYHAAKTFNTLLDGYRFTKRIGAGDADDYVLLFEREGKVLLAAWTRSKAGRIISLPSAAGEFPVTGHLGEALPTASAKDGKLALTLGENPFYLAFSGANAPLSAVTEAVSIRVTVLPCQGDSAVVRVAQLADRRVKVTVKLADLAGLDPLESAKEIEIDPAQAEQEVLFKLKAAPAGEYRIGAKVESGGAVLLDIPARRFAAADPALIRNIKIIGEGDAKVPGTFAVTARNPPGAAAGAELAVRLDYEFTQGWKYARVAPSGALPIDSSVDRFGVWIFGDASYLVPRLRVKDAGGRIWQPSGPAITWTGWRFVEMKIDEFTAHWGGANAEEKRGPRAPFTWDSVMLLDNPAKTAAKGSIYFKAPLVVGN